MPRSVRLQPMGEAAFRRSIARSVVRYASIMSRRGHWTAAASREAARSEFAQLLPQGRHTPNHRFAVLVDSATGQRVGETWCTVRRHGGKLQFWVDWLWIDPRRRRKGYARAALRALGRQARREGADRLSLSVLADNRAALALYHGLGFEEDAHRMTLRFEPDT